MRRRLDGVVRRLRARLGRLAAVGLLAATGCSGTTGGAVVEFAAYARGPADAVAGAPYTFSTGTGYAVALTRAQLYIGAVYLNQSAQSSANFDSSCVSYGLYVGEVTRSLSVDALSGALQPFPARGRATSLAARTGELWLSGGPILADEDQTPILELTGEATRGSERYPFEARFTIGRNRAIPVQDPALPSANPICKQRVVSGIAAELLPTPGGSLEIEVDPRGWFSGVDFSALERTSEDPLLYRFVDENVGGPSQTLYNNLRARSGVYSLRWRDAP